MVIVDTSNEIGGDGDVPHPAIGNARRMQVADATRQHDVMVGGGVLPAGHPCCAVLLLLRCTLRLTWSCMPVAALSIGWNPDAVLLVVLADAAVFASSNLASTVNSSGLRSCCTLARPAGLQCSYPAHCASLRCRLRLLRTICLRS